MAPKHLNFITGNANKLKEVQSILSATPVELRNQNLDVPELQGTIEEISRDKCAKAADIVRYADMTLEAQHEGMELG
jgi:inosine triphosphate pyrophosphatase